MRTLATEVVVLADELVVIQNVKLLAGAELLATHEAREAVEVEHLVPCFAHQVTGGYALQTPAALGAVSPAHIRIRRSLEGSGDIYNVVARGT